MRENEKESKDDNVFCLGYCLDGGAITDVGHFSFGLVEFWGPEGHSNGDVQLTVGYSGLGLRREVLNGDTDFWS